MLLHVLFYEGGEEPVRMLLTKEQMKQADAYTISQKGIPAETLMERAAFAFVEALLKRKTDLSKVCVLCGTGNNGGDGLAIARILKERNVDVTVVVTGDQKKGSPLFFWEMQRLLERGCRMEKEYREEDGDLLVDAMFGVGLSRELSPRDQELIRRLNALKKEVWAVDVPSGVCVSTGKIYGEALKAQVTVTFQVEKPGLFLFPGKQYAGEILCRDIGISLDGVQEKDACFLLEQEEYRQLLPLRKEDSHKGTYGKILLIAGSRGMAGAAYLSGQAAYLSGAGMVRIYTPAENRVILQTLLPQAMVSEYESFDRNQLLELLNWADAVTIGPGMGTGADADQILETVLKESGLPCVIDADGLNLLAQRKLKRKQFLGRAVILTPHIGEMSRLLQCPAERWKEERIEVLREFVRDYQVTCILKDARTLVADERRMALNLTGNQSVAKAGSGDILSGILTALLAQGMDPWEAGALGVWLHGRAADLAREQKGSYSVLEKDFLESLGRVWKEEEER
ncbi:NAD(P)H-hydrate dehydratase [Suipraeoptans intestinalis]|uniref:NAD(P)H-hydrate dehydratase n=1 Tax=Suipraeoptans intestinalis TaxID=2606628 RepID=UPI0023F06166|nr:NAD(P)H-hydrate dehydratase [Suipraeoptans intestinalis]MDD7770005.1 NAD(P)H-hydrate dehydratase [Suipraeoptans intestinalis]MDY3122078.1 NAD(P)H-hydrate dehydratase [Suipraeoptans intestinalis]